MHIHIFDSVPAYININSIAFISRMMPRVMVEYLAKTLADIFLIIRTAIISCAGLLRNHEFQFQCCEIQFQTYDIKFKLNEVPFYTSEIQFDAVEIES